MFEFGGRSSVDGRWTRVFSRTPGIAVALLLAAAVAHAASSEPNSDSRVSPAITPDDAIAVQTSGPGGAAVVLVAAAGDEGPSVADQPVVTAVPPSQVPRDADASETASDFSPEIAANELRESNAVRMSAVSRVSLRLLGFSDLNGGYAINAGTISIPGVGRFDVSDKTIGEFEAALTVRLTDVFRRDIAVAVEVDRYAPYFVTGQVANPGEIDWRPGLTLIQAIALAGGEQRSQTGVTADNLPTIQQARSQIVYSMAELERLKTEKDELKGFSRADQTKGPTKSGNAELDALSLRQDEILRERRTMMHTQLDGLRREHESAVTLLQSSEAQAASVDKQLELARSLMNSIGKLHAKKLVANARYLQQQRDVAAMELQLAEFRGLVETARARVAATERQITVFQQQRLAAVNERIEALQREIALHESTVASFSSTPATEPQTPPALEYNIARQTNGVIETIPTHVFTEVMPGDVIIVSPRAPDPQRSANADRTRLGSVSDPMRETIVRTERLINASAANRLPLAGRLQQMAVRPVERR